MTSPLELETILSEFDDKSEAWVLQDSESKKYVTIPDPRYPGKHPVRFFLRREDAESILVELLDQNPRLQGKDIFPIKVKLVPALKGIASDRKAGNADSFVVHSPNEVYEWLRERA
jgi:hypothetical protein